MSTTNQPTDATLKALALADGWSYSQASLYDEEGIEGFLWTHPDRTGEFTSRAVGGDWANGPELPEGLRDHYAAGLEPEPVRADFANFLDSLRLLLKAGGA